MRPCGASRSRWRAIARGFSRWPPIRAPRTRAIPCAPRAAVRHCAPCATCTASPKASRRSATSPAPCATRPSGENATEFTLSECPSCGSIVTGSSGESCRRPTQACESESQLSDDDFGENRQPSAYVTSHTWFASRFSSPPGLQPPVTGKRVHENYRCLIATPPALSARRSRSPSLLWLSASNRPWSQPDAPGSRG